MIDRADWISLGFVLTRMQKERMPYCISTDFCRGVNFPSFHLCECIDPDDGELAPRVVHAFGVPLWAESLVVEIVAEEMCIDSRYIAPDCCLTRDSLRNLISLARIDRTVLEDSLFVEVGIHKAVAAAMDRPKLPLHRPTRETFSSMPGRLAAIEFGNALHPDGEAIGFETFVVDTRCTYDWREYADSHNLSEFETRLNSFGLFDSDQVATQSVREMLSKKVARRFARPFEETEASPTFNVVLMRHRMEDVMLGASAMPDWDAVRKTLASEGRGK